MTQKFTISTPPSFNFWRTVYSHGWCALPPFRIDKEKQTFRLLLSLRNGSIVSCALRNRSHRIQIRAEAKSKSKLKKEERQEVKARIRSCFRLDEDFSEFYGEAKKQKQFRWIPREGAGRLLRAPTVFEDVVKMICTTNCSWNMTETMVNNLTECFGEQLGDRMHSFPPPAAIAGSSDAFLRKHVRSGYRSPYLIELAENVSAGKIDLEAWRNSSRPTPDLFKQVRSVKGVGDYAAGNLLKLLGRYDYLGLDSWVRGKFYEIHKRGKRVSDATIERHYDSLGRWRGLFFWLDMTKEWYRQKFPF